MLFKKFKEKEKNILQTPLLTKLSFLVHFILEFLDIEIFLWLMMRVFYVII